jgi:arsenate reductase
MIMDKKKVLFICTHNSARSQMAEGLLNGLYGDQFEAFSAGTHPSSVNPYAIKVMKEIGIDISKHYSKSIEEFRGIKFDYIVTVCDNAKEACPFFPDGKKYIHKGFQDPSQSRGTKEYMLSAFRQTRCEIKDWIDEIFGQEDEQTDEITLEIL